MTTDSRETFDVALCQYELSGAPDVRSALDRAGTLLDRAGPADLYVLPELFTADRPVEVTDRAEDAVLTADEVAAVHEFVATEATDRDAVVVGGSYNVAESGAVYNRCPVGVPGEDVLTYDKRHLTPEERRVGKSPGVEEPPLLEHRGVTVGVVVCYDVEFPEWVRALANRGAEVVAVPSWTGDEAGYQRVARCSAARAVEDQAYVAQVCLVGDRPDREAGGAGRSAVYAPCDGVLGPDGTRLSLPANQASAATCSLDVAALRESRRTAEVRPYTDSVELDLP